MSKLLLKSVKIIDAASSFHGKVMDLHIEDGVIKAIDQKISLPDATVVEQANVCVSPGWMDLQANFCDPGYEYREDLLSGMDAAAAGGYTRVCVSSATHPAIHSKAEVEYVRNKAKGHIVAVHPLGTVSHNREGKDISEMYDMHKSGAIAFSDDKRSIENAGLLLRALLYAKNFDGLVITCCDEKSISLGGKMNEGITSTMLGLKGIPSLAEELMVSRNLHIAAYTDAKIHISNVSAAKSVELIREAKAKGIKVTASVNVINLILDDTALNSFDSNYKVNPPLRTRMDIEALLDGLKDGTLDCIVSDHSPQDIEGKRVEFDHATTGIIGLETCFSLLMTHLGVALGLELIVDKLSAGPRRVVGIAQPIIKVGERAELTLFQPAQEWTLEKQNIVSRSSNTPFIGERLKGKVWGIIREQQWRAVEPVLEKK